MAWFTMMVAVIGTVSISAGMAVNQRQTGASEVPDFIGYVRGKEYIRQRVVVENFEIELDVTDNIRAVMDYEQAMMVFTQTFDKDHCYVTHFNKEKMPTFEDLKQKLMDNKKFNMPQKQYKMYLQESDDQRPLTLNALSMALCDGLTVSRLNEYNPGTAIAKSKNDSGAGVGWGEILLIVIVIILL